MNDEDSIEALLEARAEIDAKLEKLRAAALKTLERLGAALPQKDRVRDNAVFVKVKAVDPIDETDAGNGVREIETNVSAASFKDELHALRERSMAKRRRA